MGKKKGGVRIKSHGPKMPNMMTPPTMEDFAIPDTEMINLPPTPDRSYQVFWPIYESLSMKIDDFQVIYPIYLDSTKTVKQGRRLDKEKSVQSPSVSDVSQALQKLQIKHVIQPYKGYSRDILCQWDNPGRCLVDVSSFTKQELLEKIATIISELPTYQARLEQQAAELEKQKIEQQQQQQQQQQAEKAAAEAAAASKQQQSSKSNVKKKGKKGKRK